jgi:hypothetical protein
MSSTVQADRHSPPLTMSRKVLPTYVLSFLPSNHTRSYQLVDSVKSATGLGQSTGDKVRDGASDLKDGAKDEANAVCPLPSILTSADSTDGQRTISMFSRRQVNDR